MHIKTFNSMIISLVFNGALLPSGLYGFIWGSYVLPLHLVKEN